MIETTVSALIHDTGAEELVSGDNRVLCGCWIDTRLLQKNGIFVAFSGEHVDGNAYVPEAIRAGAGCVVLTAEPAQTTCELARAHGCALVRAKADDGEAFMLALAGAWRRRNRWTVLAVTGSVGKTTTKNLTAAALAMRYRVHATHGNYNNILGVPLTLLAASAEDDVLVIEMGMDHAGEIARLARCALPHLAIITNIGTSHLGFLGTRAHIARAKAEVVEGLSQRYPSSIPIDPVLIMPSSDDFATLIADEFARPRGVRLLYAGTAQTDEVRCTKIVFDAEGCPSFDAILPSGDTVAVSLRIRGRAAVQDAALALAAAGVLAVDVKDASRSLATVEPSSMRQEIIEAPCGWRAIDDTYNASPASMAASLDLLCSCACTGRRIAVLGAMNELGDASPELHRLVGAYAAAKHLDMLVVVGDGDSTYILEGARTMGIDEKSIVTVSTNDAACMLLRSTLKRGDMVLFKASRAVRLDEVVKGAVA